MSAAKRALNRWRGMLSVGGAPIPPDLERALDALVNRLVVIALFVYPLVLAGLIQRLVIHGWRSNVVLQIGFLPLLVVVYLLRHRIGFRAKALGLTAVVFVMGFAGLYQWGLVGMGIPSLFFAVLFTSNVLRANQTYAVLGLAVLAILAVGYGAVHGGLHDDIDVRGYVTGWNGWLVAASQFVLLVYVILTAFRTMYDELTRMFAGAEQRARELEESRARLDAEVSQRMELEAQFIQAQKMEAVGRLAGGVAHDFNNQLQVIISMAEMLERRADPDTRQRRDLGLILQSARRSADLTRQLLTFSRKQTIQPRVLSLNDVVRGIERMLARLIAENIELALELDPKLELVSVDEGLLEQAVVNLVVNARDAMPRGGRLTVHTSNRRLEGEVSGAHGRIEPGSYVVLAVSDTGAGMGSDTMSHIFEPFFTTKDRDKGTGLGLASVYGFVKQSGGEVQVESEEGAGTTISLYFPQFEVDRLPDARPEAHAATERGQERILLVEDEEDVRNLLSGMLRELGYAVVSCGDGETALRLSEEQEQFDLLVSDLILPGMTGTELADRLRERKEPLRMLFMSGYSEDVISPHGVLESGVRFLQKPIDRATLARSVRAALESE